MAGKKFWTMLFFIFCHFSKWNVLETMWNFEKSSTKAKIWLKMGKKWRKFIFRRKTKKFRFSLFFNFLVFHRKNGGRKTKNQFSSFLHIIRQILMIFQSFTLFPAHSTLKNGKIFAKNEEKPCSWIFSSQKLKFSVKLVEKNAKLPIF